MKQKQIVRQKFRDDVFGRDRHKCKFCDVTVNLDAHHITDRTLMPNGGYVKENGITLCPEHHIDAEQYHISDGIKYVDGMHPDDLYRIISSSYELSLAKSKKSG
jgi:predicted restriction endonuclease